MRYSFAAAQKMVTFLGEQKAFWFEEPFAPENLDDFDRVLKEFEKEKFFVNVSIMLSTGIYISRTERTNRELDLIERYNTPVDNHFKIVKPKTKGRLCFYPAMTYYIMYDGSIRVACLDGTAQDLFRDGIPPVPREAVPCEYEQCVGCSDMYRALVDEPLIKDPLKLFTLEDYAEEVKAYRREWERKEALRKLPLIGSFFRKTRTSIRTAVDGETTKNAASSIDIADTTAGAPLPDSAVFGYNDHAFIQARSRDRISISGWAASRRGAPLDNVRLTINGHEIGVIRDFFERPDVAQTYARPELAKSGWRTMVYLPALPHGEYDLVPVACDTDGQAVALGATKIKIVD
jgi:hypothetical protein